MVIGEFLAGNARLDFLSWRVAVVAAGGFVWQGTVLTKERNKHGEIRAVTAIHRSGNQQIKDTTKRAAAFRGEIAGKFGVKVSEVLWTLGQYDVVVLAEAPNDEAMAACSLSVARLGNVKIQTLRAFQAPEVDALLGKL